MAEAPPTTQDTQSSSPLVSFDIYLSSKTFSPTNSFRTKRFTQ